jgi:hypothetical protein
MFSPFFGLLDCASEGLTTGVQRLRERPEAGALELCEGNSDQQRKFRAFGDSAQHKLLLRIKPDRHFVSDCAWRQLGQLQRTHHDHFRCARNLGVHIHLQRRHAATPHRYQE